MDPKDIVREGYDAVSYAYRDDDGPSPYPYEISVEVLADILAERVGRAERLRRFDSFRSLRTPGLPHERRGLRGCVRQGSKSTMALRTTEAAEH